MGEISTAPGSPEPIRYPIRHLLIGVPDVVHLAIHRLHQLGYAEAGLTFHPYKFINNHHSKPSLQYSYSNSQFREVQIFCLVSHGLQHPSSRECEVLYSNLEEFCPILFNVN